MKITKRIRRLFIKQDGGKEVIDKTCLLWAFSLILGLGAGTIIFSNYNHDNSVIAVADAPIEMGDKDDSKEPAPISPKLRSLFKASEQIQHTSSPKKKAKSLPKQKLKYRAPQVIIRGDDDSAIGKLSMGAKLIGKLLTSIDTRESEQFYQVLLPYGGKGKHGEGIPKNTLLFGTINYPNKGRKVFMQFAKALLPNGREVELKVTSPHFIVQLRD